MPGQELRERRAAQLSSIERADLGHQFQRPTDEPSCYIKGPQGPAGSVTTLSTMLRTRHQENRSKFVSASLFTELPDRKAQ